MSKKERCCKDANSLTPKIVQLALRRRRSHDARDLTENSADAAGNVGHNCARGHRDEAGHQSILNEVLASGILPDSQLPYQIGDSFHIPRLHLEPLSLELNYHP